MYTRWKVTMKAQWSLNSEKNINYCLHISHYDDQKYIRAEEERKKEVKNEENKHKKKKEWKRSFNMIKMNVNILIKY